MNRNDKNKKFTPLNINNVFKGKSVEPQNKPSYKLGGMQNIGKVSSMRRVPPPKWVPSLKAETGVSDGRQIINQSTSGWVNPVSSQENSELNNIKPQGITSKIGPDRSQWNSKLTTNKPFFLIGQEFPSLQSDTGHEPSQDSNAIKDKFKDSDSKSKIDELRNRDTNISVSTLNRIDALSISKSTKGDIAATGWAAEDEEPNFDEKIVFSDEESSNEIHNWHSDNEDGSKSEKHEVIDIPPIISDVWHDQNQVMRFSQFQQMQVPMNVQGQFISNPQFPTNIINRNPSCTISNMGDEQAAFMNSVAEKRNARNMEYMYAIERARQKKLATQSSRGSCGINDEHNQIDAALMRSRHTSMTSDTTESMNTPIEMGPPGGPPMMHHLHKPHLQPQISPMIHPHNISVISPSLPPQSILRFAPHSYNIMPIPAVPMDVDTKLMEKFVEFLKLQSNTEVSGDITSVPIEQSQQPTIVQETDVKASTIASISSITDNSIQNEQERSQSHLSSLSQLQIEKENNTERPPTSISKDNNDDADRDLQKKSKSNYSHEEDSIKYDQSKKGTKNRNFKEYRPNKNVYKGDYSNNPGGSGGTTDRDYYAENDVMAYEDYNTYKQHYSSRDYKSARGYNSRNNTSYSYYSDQYSSQSRDNNYASDYHYKSNSLKSKSSSKSKELKSSASNVDHSQLERDSSKKYTSENQELWPYDNDITDSSDKKTKDTKKTPKPSKTASYTTKKFDSRHYKEKSNETPQEYSMGFAVNPKESRKNYYSSNYNRRYYPDYKYYNPSSKYDEYEEDSYYPESYYQQDNYYPYDKDMNYSSNKSTNKRSAKGGSNTGESWRQNKDEKSNNPRNNSETTNSANTSSNPTSNQSKNVNRNNRKSDKRQFSTTKDNNNDNDQDEWETASEGGSVRSSSAPRDLHKMHNRQNNCQLNTNENKSISNNNNSNSNNSENRKAAMNKAASSYSCNGGNNSFNDNNGNQDGNGGASGSSGGNRFRSNVSQNRSGDSTQNKNMEKTSNNENRNSDSTSKNCSNNNNSSKESSFNVDSKHLEIVQRTSIDNTSISPTINLDKFSEFIEDEDVLFENSQFQEVLSKATKKNRKLEEQRRIKEELKLEQKRLEAAKFKSKSECNSNRKSTNRRDQLQRSNKSEITIHKYENKTASNMREKDTSNNTFKKWDTKQQVSMQIGSWDNSLADEISSEKKAPPKPIGTPASTVPWNKKVKGTFETNSSNNCQHTLSNESIKLSTDIETVPQPFSSETTEVNFNTTSYSYNNPIYNSAVRTSEENKIDSSIEAQNSEIVIHENINFEYDVKNINCDKSHRNLLSADRNVQNNDQKLLNDKINSVKTIWDSLPVSNIPAESKVTISSPSISQDLDIHTGPVSINQDVSNTRNIDNLTSPPVPIPNVCKVKPQLQQDFKKDHNEIIITSQAFPIRNSPAAFLSQNQGGFLPYHRFPEYLSETLHATDGYSSLISNSQPGMHINYNLSNTHLIDSSLLRQNTQEQINKQMNFINHTQSSYYPQQATTPKLMSNTPAQLPINMDMGSAHAPQHHMQQLLLTRQNSLTSSMMQPNPMTIPFIQSGQQPIQAQTPIFPTTPLLGATNFSSQINPFSQTHLQPHYPHSNFPSLHHTPQFQPNQQMLLNQHPHHQQQQLIQAPLSHDRVINSGGQSGVFNSVIGPSDISTNTGLTDFNGQPKPLTHHNNIMHGMSGSAFVLPHNLNILMKPPMFATNSQYNTFTTPIQSNLLNLKNGFDHNTNIKSLDLDHYRHDNSMNDRNIYCGDNTGMQKSNEEYYQDVSEYDNCDMNYDNWVPNLRYSKVDIYTANNLMPTFDFHSQKSPMQFSPLEAGGDAATYRNFITSFRDNHNNLAAAGLPTNTSLQYIISPRIKPQFNQEQPVMISKQHSKCYDNLNYISSNNFISKNESTDNKISIKSSTCSNSINEPKDSLSKDISNLEKSITENKKNSKQRTSYSDNFDEKNQTWSLMEDDRSVPPEDNRSSIKSSNTENSSHSPNKHFNNSRPSNTNFDNQCQYGYDETQLSSQTAESLRKFDQDQLKKVIMKLREGPVMTDTNCSEFDFTSYKGATIPRLMPLQSSRSKPNNNNSNNNNNKSFNNYNNSFPSDNYGNENVGLGFYSRNRALTPPAAHFRTYRSKTNRHANSLIPNNPSINRVSRQKCDTNNTDVDSNDLKLNNVQSKSLECDNLVLENIIDNSIL